MNVISEEVLELRHTIGAPVDVAFDAWTSPAQVEDWWGPHGYKTKVLKLEAFEGGEFLFRMTGPSGASCLMSGIYTRFERPNLLAFIVKDHCIADIPNEVRVPNRSSQVEVRFEGYSGKTEIVLRHSGLDLDYRLLAEVGWSQSLERAQQVLQKR